ncbi:MAG: lysylphosphatidylglycerol synthase transmembrane domain-containing protein [Tepidiformaceae bacterium]
MRRFIIGLVVSGLSVALLYFATDWSRTLPVLKRAEALPIALAVLCLLASLAAKTVRWRLLLPASADVTMPRLSRIMYISFLLNNVLPARVGDVARVAMTSRQPGVRVGHVVSSLLTERVADAAVLVGCFLVISPFLPLPSAYQEWVEYAWAAALGVALLVGLGFLSRSLIARTLNTRWVRERLPARDWLRLEVASFAEGWRSLFSLRRLVGVWGWSAAAWAGAFAINYLLMQALDIKAPITVAILLTCTTNLAMLIPSSPGYVGVFHAAATLSLLPFDVSAPVALSFAVLAHLVNVLPVSLLGIAFLLWGRETISLSKRPPTTLAS